MIRSNSKPIWRTILALSCAAAAIQLCPANHPARASEIDGGAADQTLKTARQLIARQQYRAAEQLLQQLVKTGDDASKGRAQELIGELYLRSGQHRKAIEWFKQAAATLEQRPASTIDLLRERSRNAILLARAYSALEQAPNASATLREAYALYARRGVVDPPIQIRLLARLAINSDAAKSVREWDRDLEGLLARLEANHNLGEIADDDFLRAKMCAAEYQCSMGRRDLAIAMLRRLINERDSQCKFGTVLAVHRQLADNLHDSGDTSAEIDTLQSALRFAADASTRSKDHDELTAQDLFDRAEIERQLADCFLRSADRKAAAAQMVAALNTYALVSGQELDALDGDDSNSASSLLLLQRIAQARSLLLELPNATPRMLRDAIESHEALLERYQRDLFAEDSRIAQVQTALGGLYLSASRFKEAGERLNVAKRIWLAHDRPNYPMLAQTLNLLGETALGSATTADAHENLKNAAKILAEHCPDDELSWRVRLNLARLDAASGRYRQAMDSLKFIIGAASGPSSAVQSLARLQLALLYKQQLQLDEAMRLCSESLQLRQAELGDRHIDLLPHYLALGEVQIAMRDPELLAETTARSEGLTAMLPEDHTDRLVVAHHRAMVHFLRNQRDSDANERKLAGQIWSELSEQSRRVEQSALRARALHYLSRLDYLDWSAEVSQWNKQLLDDTATQTQESVGDFRKRAGEYDRRLSAAESDRQEFLRRRDQWDQISGEDGNQRQKAYDDLRKRRDALNAERSQLRAMAAALEDDRARLLSRAAATNNEVSGENLRRWNDMLDHGQKQAAEAIAILRATKLFPSLHHAALCNYAQLLQAKSQLTGSDESRYLDQALDTLREAAAIIEAPRTEIAAGDWMRAEFFTQYQAAVDLEVRICVRAGRVTEALVAAERGRARSLLDRLRSDRLTDSQIAAVIGRWQNSQNPLLYYYVSDAFSYLFVLGGAEPRIQVFPLRVDPMTRGASVATSASASDVAAKVLLLRAESQRPTSAQTILSDERSRQRLAAASAVLLPPQVVEYLRSEKKRGASYVTVIPHGAIALMPLEALVVQDDLTRPYLIDHVPPLAYAPSLLVLEALRDKVSEPAPMGAVTLGNPNFQRRQESGVELATFTDDRLNPLAHSREECDRIATAFQQPLCAARRS